MSRRYKGGRIQRSARARFGRGLVLLMMGLWLPSLAATTAADDGPLNLDEKVGWYRIDDGSVRMVTWSASGGLVLNDFDERENSRLEPVSEDIFTMRPNERESYEVRFQTDGASEVIGFGWIDDRGVQRTAERLRSGPYEQREVRYRNGRTELVGLLLIPNDPGPHPAVTFIHGSGIGERDNFWYLYQADYLAKNGVAVLLPDKRGCGKSSGEWQTASFDDFAGDATSAVHFLKSIHEIDRGRIGLAGMSHGGWIAPLAASASKDVRFVVSVSGSAVTPNEQMRHEISSDVRRYGTPDFLVPLIAFAVELRSKHKEETWWEENGRFDAVKYWQELKVPVLVVYGGNDEQENVPVRRSIARLEEAKQKSRNPNFTIEVFESAGHLLEDKRTGWIHTGYLELLATWILNQTA